MFFNDEACRVFRDENLLEFKDFFFYLVDFLPSILIENYESIILARYCKSL